MWILQVLKLLVYDPRWISRVFHSVINFVLYLMCKMLVSSVAFFFSFSKLR